MRHWFLLLLLPTDVASFAAPSKSTAAATTAAAISRRAVHPATPRVVDGDWLFGCRHEFELTLIDELVYRNTEDGPSALSLIARSDLAVLAPGLVCVSGSSRDALVKAAVDPTYALQSLPSCRVVRGDSINLLAKAAVAAVSEHPCVDDLKDAPRGALAVHSLVPESFRAAAKAALASRSDGVGEAVTKALRGGFTAARSISACSTADATAVVEDGEKWLLQLLLLDRGTLVVSLARCGPHYNDHGSSSSGWPRLNFWPNWHRPAGLAPVDVEAYMPSSAYRKLAEALDFMGLASPLPAAHSFSADDDVEQVILGSGAAEGEGDRRRPLSCVDLGATPGGWTAYLRRCGWRVVAAVDSSPDLDPILFQNGKPANAADFERRGGRLGFEPAAPEEEQPTALHFERGDAFSYEPPALSGSGSGSDSSSSRVDLMVSDVAAYPERVAELLERWCGGHWAQHIIVTCKFQGSGGSSNTGGGSGGNRDKFKVKGRGKQQQQQQPHTMKQKRQKKGGRGSDDGGGGDDDWAPAGAPVSASDWEALEAAVAVAAKHGYHHRSKHFFNNKNECTLMLTRGGATLGSGSVGETFGGGL